MDVINETSPNLTKTVSENEVIWNANEKIFEINLPVVICLTTIMIVGMLGNSLVVYIYSRYFPKTTGNFYILILGIFDIIASCMIILEVLDRRYPMYSGQIPALCKIVRLTEFVVNASSMGLLICIAFDRYYKVCHPMKSFTKGGAKKLLALILCLVLFIVWPMALFHGSEKVDTTVPGVYGYDCADDDNLKDTMVMMGYYLTIAGLYLISFIVLVVMYSMLYRAVWKWKKTSIGEDIAKIRQKSTKSLSIISDSARSLESISVFERQDENDNIFSREKFLNSQSQNEENKKILKKAENGLVKSQESGTKHHDTKHKTVISCFKDMEQTKYYKTPTRGQSPSEKVKFTDISIDSDNKPNKTVIITSEMNTKYKANSKQEQSQNSKDQPLCEKNGTLYKHSHGSCSSLPSIEGSDKEETKIHPRNSAQFIDYDNQAFECQEERSIETLGKLQIKNSVVKKTSKTSAIDSVSSEASSKLRDTVRRKFCDIRQSITQRFSTQSEDRRLSGSTHKSSASMRKNTWIFCVVTVAYILSYMPYFIIESLNASRMLAFDDLSLGGKQTVRVLNSSFCLNNAINPIIYSILNPKFRQEVKNILLCRCKHRKPNLLKR